LPIALEFRGGTPAAKIKNVGKGQGILRLITGVILIVFAFFISGLFRWISGVTGGALVLQVYLDTDAEKDSC
jgi:predicted phage tail protein